MTKIPDEVDKWTEGKILDILKEGFDEDESLEFKETLNIETKKIPKTVCAFANSIGGTFVFGISDDREKSASDRIIGIEKSEDIKKKINDQLQNIRPNIPIQFVNFKKNYIDLENGKVIVIVKIEQSSMAPHQYENIFLKRVNSSNAPMELEQIKTKILENQKNQAYMATLDYQAKMLFDILSAIILSIESKKSLSIEAEINSIDMSGFQHFLYNRAFLYGAETIQDVRSLNYEMTLLTRDKDRYVKLLIDREIKAPVALNNLKTHIYNSIKIIKKLIQEFGWSDTLPQNSFTEQVKKLIKKKSKKLAKPKK